MNLFYSLVPLLLLTSCVQPSASSVADTGIDDDQRADRTPTWTEGQDVAVVTGSGPVVGSVHDGVASFVGIPYAAPPLGAQRWRPPIDPTPWSEPRDATHLGPACAQPSDPSSSEDCLTINVWTPRIDDAAPLPVMVFIYGGADTTGSSSMPLYDGHALAAAGPVVLVTFNYRLGPLGFLAHPALDAEDTAHHVSGNQGLLDQQAALRWVQRNAAAVGGDPARVTVFGESAGAIAICSHMTSPLAIGLFRAAIAESGSCTFVTTPLRASSGPSGETLGAQFAHGLGCDLAADPLACMRDASTSEVLAAVPAAPLLDTTHASWGPVIDGYVLPQAPAAAIRAGTAQRVPFVTGVNRDEGTLFVGSTPIATAADYEAAITALVPHHLAEALALYPESSYASYRAAYAAFLTDVLFVCPARAQAAAIAAVEPRTYFYDFTRENLAGWLSGLGVFHSSELPYVFDNFTTPFYGGLADRMLAVEMGGYWTRFARSIDPNGLFAPAWPAYTGAGDSYLTLGSPVDASDGLHASACATVDTWQANP